MHNYFNMEHVCGSMSSMEFQIKKHKMEILKPRSDELAFEKIRHTIEILHFVVKLMLWVVGE